MFYKKTGYPVNEKTGKSCKTNKGIPKPDCVFRVAMRDQSEGYASVMYKQYHHQVINYVKT